jgi:hypothetical protein
MEENIHEQQLNEKAKQLAGQVTDYVNTFSNDRNKQFAQALAHALSREHRTLQQSTLRLMLETIEMMAGEEYRVDGRNEGSKKVAQRLMTGFAKEVALEQNIPVEDVLKSWDVYRPSKWLGHI